MIIKNNNILIDNTRKAFTNKSCDVTIIEIKKEDKINEKSFFDLDKQIFEENHLKTFRNCQIYLLHYPQGIKMEISPGIIQNITEDDDIQKIHHLCSTSTGSSGCPIINKNNFRIIGIHKAAGNKNFNIGILLKKPIELFIEEIEKKENYININKIDNYNCNNKENEEKIKIKI